MMEKVAKPKAVKRPPTAPPPPPPGEGPSLRRRFIALDDQLASKGVKPLTKWWRDGIGAWLDRYEQHGVLEFWACVGRGAGKSVAMCKLAMFFTIEGSFDVPPGEIHYAMILSRRKDEAQKSVAIMARWLELLGISARRRTIKELDDGPGGHMRITGHLIEFPKMRRGIRVAAANVQATSGWRAFFVAKDERSKWKLSGIDDEDADEIDTSAAAMTATHAHAPTVTIGSAWGTDGVFYDMFKKPKIVDGDRAQPRHAHVLGPTPTWIAAPHATEASLRIKERDNRKFLREYASVFQPGLLGAFDPDLVEAAFERPCGYCKTTARPFGEIPYWCGLTRDHDGPHVPLASMPNHITKFTRCQMVALIDPSAGFSDTFAWAMVGWRYMLPRHPAGHPMAGEVDLDGESTYRLVFDFVDGIQEATKLGYTSADVVKKIALDAHEHQVKKVFSDQYAQFGLDTLFRQEGFDFSFHTWSNKSKELAMERVRAWLADRMIVFGDDSDGTLFAKLKHELLSFEEKIAKSGALTFQARRGGHDDFCMLVMLAAIVDIERGLPGSPLFLRGSQPAQENSIVENRSPENTLGVMSDALLDGLAMPMD